MRVAKYYIGVWIPLSACWVVVVFAATAVVKDADVAKGLLAAVFGPPLAIVAGVLNLKGDKNGSLAFVASHREWSDRQLFTRGLKSGALLGPISVVGVAAIGALPFLVDRVLMAMGK